MKRIFNDLLNRVVLIFNFTIKAPLLSILFLSISPQLLADTLYEDAEDGSATGWMIYDSNPSGATVANVYDADKSSYVIEFTGDKRKNGYRLGHSNVNNNGNTAAWNNTVEKVIS